MKRLSVSVPEAGEMLGLSRSSTYAAVQRGDIPSIRVGGRVLVPLSRLEALINEAPTVSVEAPSEILADPSKTEGSAAHV